MLRVRVKYNKKNQSFCLQYRKFFFWLYYTDDYTGVTLTNDEYTKFKTLDRANACAIVNRKADFSSQEVAELIGLAILREDFEERAKNAIHNEPKELVYIPEIRS